MDNRVPKTSAYSVFSSVSASGPLRRQLYSFWISIPSDHSQTAERNLSSFMEGGNFESAEMLVSNRAQDPL